MAELDQTLETLAADYVVWQNRLEALEAERPGVNAKVMELQEKIMDSGDAGDPLALQTAKTDLIDLDQRLEAAGLKLKDLWRQMKEAARASLGARYLAIPKIQAALDLECQEKCEQAAVLLAEAMSLIEDLGIHPENLVRVLGIGRGSPAFNTAVDDPLGAAYARVKGQPLTAQSLVGSYRQKRNEVMNFLARWQGDKDAMYRQAVNAAIQAAGGSPRPKYVPYFGEREKQYVGADI